MDKEHLGNKEEVQSFCDEMIKQLELHEKEKTPVRDWQITPVWALVTTEIETRLKTLSTLGPEEMGKQCVHMANYLMLLWLKLRM